MQQPDPINPPEIREPQERFRLVEFYVHLGEVRPEVQLFDMAANWLRENSPHPVLGFLCSYHGASENGEPEMMVGHLILGEPIDVG